MKNQREFTRTAPKLDMVRKKNVLHERALEPHKFKNPQEFLWNKNICVK